MDLICGFCDFEFGFQPTVDEEQCPNCGKTFDLEEAWNDDNWWWEITWHK